MAKKNTQPAEQATATNSPDFIAYTVVSRNADTSKARYRNPADPAQHWNGHGRRPQWVEQHLARGGTLAELEMKPAR